MYKTSHQQMDHHQQQRNDNTGYTQSLIYSHSASALDSPAIEIIEDKLYWISGTVPPTSESDNAYYFSVDNVSVEDTVVELD